jgi:hypothetical protein
MEKAYTGLTSSSSVPVSTVESYVTGDPQHNQKITMVFIGWQLTGGAAIEEPGRTSTTVYKFTSSASVTAGYAPEDSTPPPTTEPGTPTTTPIPTPDITPDPPVYSLFVQYTDSNGTPQTQTHSSLTQSSVVSVSTVQSFITGDPAHGVTINMVFTSWQLSGGATVANPGSTSTTVSNFTGNASVTAAYTPDNSTPPPTPGPTDPPTTPIPTPDVTSIPNTEPPPPPPTAEPTFRRTVSWLDSTGNSHSDTYTGLTYSSSISISTTPSFLAGTTTMNFKGWNGGPCAQIDSPGSSGTMVRNFTCDCSIGASYGQ